MLWPGLACDTVAPSKFGTRALSSRSWERERSLLRRDVVTASTTLQNSVRVMSSVSGSTTCKCTWAEGKFCVVVWRTCSRTVREATVFFPKIWFGVGRMGGRVLAQWPPIILPLMRKLTVDSFFLGLGLLAVAVCRILASEFPERECCDPVYPLPAPPASTTPYPSAATPTGRSGEKRQWPYSVLFCDTTVQVTACDFI